MSYWQGTTYVLFDDVIELQKQIVEYKTSGVIVDNTIDNETVKKVLTRVNWPSRIVYSQKLDSGKFGATFYDLPRFPHKSINTNSIWVIYGMLP